MKTVGTQTIGQESNSKILTNELFNEDSKAIFLNDFQEFTLEEDIHEFNLEFLEETNSFFNYVA